jgi:predicted RNase H-like HicB family nuclease
VNQPERLTVHVHHDGDHDLWADVEELPGCFASGRDLDELREALDESVSLYLSDPGHEVRVELDVVEQQALIHTA